MSEGDYSCPICGQKMTECPPEEVRANVALDHSKNSGFLKCSGGHIVSLAKYAWEVVGIGISGVKEIRCPYCNKLFCEGDYSDREQTFKCRSCKKTSRFMRLS